MNAMSVPYHATDQASTLRSIRPQHLGLAAKREGTTKVISVTSGKGGVGKTAVTANVAVQLARQGHRVLVIDADLGLANIDVLFGLTPRYNLNHYFSGEQRLPGILIEGPAGIKVLPAGTGSQQLTHLSPDQKLRFLEDLDELHDQFDLVLIDTEAGISENVTYFNVAAQHILVVTTPEPTAITDAYALMKLLSLRYHQKHFQLLVNLVSDEDEGLDVYQKLTIVSNRYLDIAIDYTGSIPRNPKMIEAVRRQKPMVELYPGIRTTGAFDLLARTLAAGQTDQPQGTMQFFWKRFFSLNQGAES